MDNQFIFVCTTPGNEALLKEEVKCFYPELSLSYSKKGFVTFKNKGVRYDIGTIGQLELTFSSRVGLCFGKSTPDGILEELKKSDIDYKDYAIHEYSIGTDFEFSVMDLFGDESKSYLGQKKVALNIISLGPNEVWFGAHSISKGNTKYVNGRIDISVPEEAPSSGYLKLAQVVKLNSVKVNPKDSCLDFGSSPGGASHFLLEQGCRVTGIDPAKMPQEILDNISYTHLDIPVQDLSQEKLPRGDIHWVHVDMNINPKQGIKEVLRLIKKYNFSIKGIIFTVQVIKMDHVKNIERYEDHFFDWGFSDVISKQVPAHKNEYVIIATK